MNLIHTPFVQFELGIFDRVCSKVRVKQLFKFFSFSLNKRKLYKYDTNIFDQYD